MCDIAVESALFVAIRSGWIPHDDCTHVWKRSIAETEAVLFQSISANVQNLQRICTSPEAISAHVKAFYLASLSFGLQFSDKAAYDGEALANTARALEELARAGTSSKDGRIITSLLQENDKALKDLQTRVNGGMNSQYHRDCF